MKKPVLHAQLALAFIRLDAHNIINGLVKPDISKVGLIQGKQVIQAVLRVFHVAGRRRRFAKARRHMQQRHEQNGKGGEGLTEIHHVKPKSGVAFLFPRLVAVLVLFHCDVFDNCRIGSFVNLIHVGRKIQNLILLADKRSDNGPPPFCCQRRMNILKKKYLD